MEFEFNSELWEWQGKGAWCFITVPAEYSPVIKMTNEPFKKGFGSVKVSATIGKVSWSTSVFPDSKTSCYLLPVKKDIRIRQRLSVGDMVKVRIKIIEV